MDNKTCGRMRPDAEDAMNMKPPTEKGLTGTMLLNCIVRTELDPRDAIDGDGACSYLREVDAARAARKRNTTLEAMCSPAAQSR